MRKVSQLSPLSETSVSYLTPSLRYFSDSKAFALRDVYEQGFMDVTIVRDLCLMFDTRTQVTLRSTKLLVSAV